MPEDYRLAGEEDVDGVTCYVLENPVAKRLLHIGVVDGRPRRLAWLRQQSASDYALAASRAANREFADSSQLNEWFEKLTPDEWKALEVRLAEEIFPLLKPWAVYEYANYKEVSPGFWFPARQRTIHFKADGEDGSYLSGTRELELIEARVDQPLADELFEVTIPDGADVIDATYKPPMVYKQDSKRTPDAWDLILKEYREFAAESDEREAARKELIGTPCPELPAGKWLNSEPLTLASLRGRVIVLEFWSTGCAPCRGAVQNAQWIHAGGGPARVIGIHDCGGRPDEVAKFLKQAQLTFPVVIDEDVPDQLSGKFFGQLTINAIPECVVIDPEGRIAAFGQFHEVGKTIRDLIRAQQGRK